MANTELQATSYDTGNATEAVYVQELMRELLTLTKANPAPFRENELFSDISKKEIKQQFINYFHNISKIMDCVTCERCRLWGKLQILGLGTALKILLADGDEFGLGVLQRNEVVALINTLAQLAKSVDSIRDWQRRDVRRATAKMGLLACLAAAALVVVAFGLARALPR